MATLILTVIVLASAGSVNAGSFDQGSPDGFNHQAHSQNSLVPGPGTTYLGPIKEDAYGLGINADATGRSFQWQAEGVPSSGPDPTLRVTPNAYGMGAHADQYGRVVQPVPWP